MVGNSYFDYFDLDYSGGFCCAAFIKKTKQTAKAPPNPEGLLFQLWFEIG